MARQARQWLSILLLTLAACGGGGGGGGGADSNRFGAGIPLNGRLSDIAQPVSVTPGYAHLQFDHVQQPTTSSISGPGSGGLRLDIDPVAGTVGINAANTAFSIDFDDDSVAFASASSGSSLTTRYSAAMLIPGQASGYHYSSYGVWNRRITSCFLFTCGSQFYADAFYFGTPTDPSSLPASGTATFNGTMRGYHSRFSQAAAAISADATLTADFGADTVTGSFHDIQVTTLLGSPPPIFNDIHISAQIDGSDISGTVTGGAGGSGTIMAGFFGPNGEEMSGAFRMTGTGDTIGSFAARQ